VVRIEAAPGQLMTHAETRNVAPTSTADALVLPGTLQAPRLARAWVTPRLADLSPDVVSSALMLTSELVTNAVVHGGSEVHVSLRRTAPALWVAVADEDPTMPALPDQPVGPTAVSGRGLFIVSRLATAWGIDLHDEMPGKTVWFRLNTD
jgi:anti-sigma regulatory factor (Ser/Thr protein kinase)